MQTLRKENVVLVKTKPFRVWRKNSPTAKSLGGGVRYATKTTKKRLKRKSKIDLWREWNVPDNAYHRYEGLRGIYWYWLSRDVRKSEWEKWNKKCLTCLEEVDHWENGDCGHVVASHGCGEFLRLNRANLTLQHKGCNNPRFSRNASALNAIHYDQRYGQGAYERLYAKKDIQVKEPKQSEYVALVLALPSYRESLAAKL